MALIQRLTLDDVTNNTNMYNSYNHWPDGKMPDDYCEINRQTESQFWLHKFKSDYTVFDFSKSELAFMKSIMPICKIHNKIPNLHKEDVMDIVEKHSDINDILKPGKFVRAENVSLKYGKHGIGPYYNLYNIIESILTAEDGHSPLYPTTESLRLYIIPWVSLNKFKEFRCFVCNGELTAISQQYWFESNKLLVDLNDEEQHEIVHEWIKIIIDAFYDTIKPKIDHVTSYVYDFVILDDGTPYFIEINPFGKAYSSGSSTFHWLIDEEKLYGKYDMVYFRYVV